jgi:hypothetical protein
VLLWCAADQREALVDVDNNMFKMRAAFSKSHNLLCSRHSAISRIQLTKKPYSYELTNHFAYGRRRKEEEDDEVEETDTGGELDMSSLDILLRSKPALTKK